MSSEFFVHRLSFLSTEFFVHRLTQIIYFGTEIRGFLKTRLGCALLFIHGTS